MYVTERGEGQISVPIFRIARDVLRTRLAATLARTLLAGIVQSALSSDLRVVRFCETRFGSVLTTALQLGGFFCVDGAWLKLSVCGTQSVTSLIAHIADLSGSTGIGAAAVSPIREALSSATLNSDTPSVMELEHLLWPCKILGCGVPNYVIPIRPRWASDLFDAGLAKSMLWGAETELALNPDSVYYRSVKPNILEHQGRILWYVSADDDICGSKRIRACSQLTDVVIGDPKTLFNRFRRLGVYGWHNVLETAGGCDGELMALQFGDTELMPSPLDWDRAQSILMERYGIRTTFQSPVKISEEAFSEIYEAGFGRGGNS